MQKGPNLTFWPLKKFIKNDSTKSISWQLINDIPQKHQAKKEKKLLKCFSEIGTIKEKVTMTDMSSLEKLRCQVAQQS